MANMTRKLPINPDISYLLGIYSCNSGSDSISLSTSNEKIVERFVKIAVMNLDVKPENINIFKDEDHIEAIIGNSKVKKLFDNALERRDKIFKYRNEYSASYFAALFDCKGATDRKGLFLNHISNYEAVLLERIGFHTTTNANRTYIKNDMDFIMFISPFSIRAKGIHRPGNKRVPH